MKISIVILASGEATRFGSNKLLYKIDDISLIEKVFQIVSTLDNEIVVVSKYKEIQELSTMYKYTYLENKNAHKGMSESVKLGTSHFINSDAIVFMMGDQPFLTKQSLLKMMNEADDTHILRACKNGKVSTPTLIPKRYFHELLDVHNDEGGRAIMRNYPNNVRGVEVMNEKELFDIDEMKDVD